LQGWRLRDRLQEGGRVSRAWQEPLHPGSGRTPIRLIQDP
jgi:hypothetical protein